MNVFTELSKWIKEKKLPHWEQYALDLIVSGKEVSEPDIEQMVVFLLEDGGVWKGEATRVDLKALTRAAELASAQDTDRIILRGIRALKKS